MENPHTVASPQVGFNSVARMRMVVVLPAPLGPMNPYTSPRSSLSVSRSRAYRSPYILVRSRVSIIGTDPLAACDLALLLFRGRHRQQHADIRVLHQVPLHLRAQQ